jgi:hypothetical protein
MAEPLGHFAFIYLEAWCGFSGKAKALPFSIRPNIKWFWLIRHTGARSNYLFTPKDFGLNPYWPINAE